MQLGHHRASRYASGKGMPVVPVCDRDGVVVTKRRHASHGHRLLANVEMQEPADLAQGVGLARLLLEMPDDEDLPEPGPALLRGGRERGLALLLPCRGTGHL